MADESRRRRAIVEPLRAVAGTFRNRELRRLQIASGSYVLAEFVYSVGLGVYAYDEGGAAAVGLMGFVRMLPAGVSAVLGSWVTDRARRADVLIAVHLFRAFALAATAAAVLAGTPVAIVFALAALSSAASALLRPAEWALRPLLARTPEELIATNIAATVVEGAGTMIGPALAGVLLTGRGAGIVMTASAVASVAAALTASGVSSPADRVRPPTHAESPAAQTLAGIRAVATNRNPRLVVGLFFLQTVTRGALNVLIVVAAISFLDMGRSGVGYLTASFGVGGIVGSAAALTLVRRRHLAIPFGLGMVMWGAPIALLAAMPNQAAALVLLALPGVGNAFADVAGLTLLQRISPDELLGRVFGSLEAVVFTGTALGSLLASGLIAALGVRGALVAAGSFLPAAVVLAWARLRTLDSESDVPERRLELLRGIRMFAPLPPVALDHLALALDRVSVPARQTVFRSGEQGDLFYLIDSGEASVALNGRVKTRLGPGGYFGEIALLEQCPRMATVRAVSDLELFSLDRDRFVAAITGHPVSLAEASCSVDSYGLADQRRASRHSRSRMA